MVFSIHVDHAVGVVANGASMLRPHHLLEIANGEDCIILYICRTLREADILIEAHPTWPRREFKIAGRATSVVATAGNAILVNLVSQLGFKEVRIDVIDLCN